MARKIQKHIEIVRSSIPALNSLSQKSSDALYGLLKKHYATVGVSIVDKASDLDFLPIMRPDLVFMGMKYVLDLSGDKVWISEYLDQHGISHTGSPKDAIELEQDKPLAKQRVLAAGIKTSRYVLVKKGEAFDAAINTLRFPLFVKPASFGGGKGIDENSVVHNLAELNAKLAALATTYGVDALVEEFLPGREYSVAVLKEEHSQRLVAMPLELVAAPNARGLRVLSHKLKAAALDTPTFPVTDQRVRAGLIDLATRAFMALGARDYGRIDIRTDKTGTPHFLEANLVPGLIEGSGYFPRACDMNIGINYETMILHIVRLGLARQADAIEEEVDTIAAHSPVAVTALV